MRKTAVLLFMAAVFSFSGCAISREERIHRIQSQHPQWDQTTLQQVASGRVEPGMSEEMVATILGKPWQVSREDNTVVWTYMAYATGRWGEPRPVPTYFVYFKEGRVAESKGDRAAVVTPLE